MARAVALTTSDNPYNPFTDYDKWRRFDTVEHDYNTESYLDRISHSTTELGDELYLADLESTIDEAVKYNLISWLYDGVSYKKVVNEAL